MKFLSARMLRNTAILVFGMTWLSRNSQALEIKDGLPLKVTYAEAVRQARPAAYWRMENYEGTAILDDVTNLANATSEDGLSDVRDLGAPPSPLANSSLAFAVNKSGQRLKASVSTLGVSYSVELWFMNKREVNTAPITGYLFSRGIDGLFGAPGDHLGIGGTVAFPGKLFLFNGNALNNAVGGKTSIKQGVWNYLALVRRGDQVEVYLNGYATPEITATIPSGCANDVKQVYIGGRSDNSFGFGGEVDEVTVYDRALSIEEIRQHYAASEKTPPDQESEASSFVIPTYRPVPTNATRMSLNGPWKAILPAPASVESSVIDHWLNFNIPGHWELELGADSIPKTSAGGLGLDFTIPATFNDKRLFLKFDAVVGSTQYWLNGKKLGTSDNNYTPVEFEITGQANIGGLNKLRLTQTLNSFAAKIQFTQYNVDPPWPQGCGLLRGISIFALPELYVSTLHVKTDLDEYYQNGILELECKVDNPKSTTESLAVKVLISDAAGTVVINDEITSFTAPAGVSTRQIHYSVVKPVKWNAEKPYLYNLKLSLFQKDNKVEEIEKKVGFRKIEVSGSKVLLNGKAIKLPGGTHHETDPVVHQAATCQWAEKDVLLMKKINLTFARTSHYPPTEEFLDAADRLGLYVEVATPLAWTYGAEQNNPDFVNYFLNPTAATVEFARNHPSVIAWDLANESGYYQGSGTGLPANYQATNALVKQMTPDRLTVFHNVWDIDGRVPDLGNLHYPNIPFEAEQKQYTAGDSRPILCGENYYVLGTPGIGRGDIVRYDPGLRECWGMSNYFYLPHGNNPNQGYNYIYNNPQIVGFAIWAFNCDGLDGLVDLWRRLKPEAWITKRMCSPVYISTRAVRYASGQSEISVPIQNRYYFTNLNEIIITVEISDRNGVIDTDRTFDQIIARGGKRLNINLAPGDQGNLTMPIPEGTEPGALAIIRSFNVKGELIDAQGIHLGERKNDAPPLASGCPKYRNEGETITVTGDDFGFTLNKVTGQFGPVPGMAPLALKAVPTFYGSAKSAVMNTALTIFPDERSRMIDSVLIRPTTDSLLITVNDHFGTAFRGTIVIRIDRNGACILSYDYTSTVTVDYVNELGVKLVCDDGFDKLSWSRKAEWDVYPQDHLGRPEGFALAHRPAEWATRCKSTWTADSEFEIFKVPRITVGPEWPWELDESAKGTNDFCSTKYNIYQASLWTPENVEGIRVYSDGRANVRAALDDGGVLLHLWSFPTKSSDIFIRSGTSRLQGMFDLSVRKNSKQHSTAVSMHNWALNQ